MMCDCDCDPPTIYRESTPRARPRHGKVYRCCECRREISAGEVYANAFGVWNGAAETYRTCLQCHFMRVSFMYLTGCCCCLGGLKNDVADWLDEQEYHEQELRRKAENRKKFDMSECKVISRTA